MGARRRQSVTWIWINAPIGALWIIGAYVLYRSVEFAAAHHWDISIRSYIVGLSILLAGAALAAGARRDPLIDDLRDRVARLEADQDDRWDIDAEQAANELQKAVDNARHNDHITPVHIVRDEHPSP